ncbi:MAG: alpha/beta fold hydrolase, partial [Sandarakinorhabdus sp.]|nr:alpha/beta fold hydrolase [Sandarakinorhabdus sp.]
MTITRHFVDVTNPDGSKRRVHYRRAGSGPPVVLVHQSPRSSAEYCELMEKWAGDFTCLAPDTPGFGESAPLPMPNPHVNDYADAVLAFMDAVGLPQAGAYGTHSGAITLITAAKRAAHRFTAIAANGYAVWTDAERADFGANYTPAFVPLPYGEHLSWVWHRIREQSWFFPWYAADDAHRMSMAHDNAATNHAMIMDILAAGESYAQGYAAMLQAPRDLPEPGAATPPVFIS